MAAITLTSKRQATFTKEICDELKIKPGDQLDLERIVIDGRAAWIIKPHGPDWSWMGAGAPDDPTISHELNDIAASIGRGAAEDHRQADEDP
jgi:hypothetical protein